MCFAECGSNFSEPFRLLQFVLFFILLATENLISREKMTGTTFLQHSAFIILARQLGFSYFFTKIKQQETTQ